MSASPRVGVTVTIPADLLIEAGKTADRLHLNRSAVVTMALARFLEADGASPQVA